MANDMWMRVFAIVVGCALCGARAQCGDDGECTNPQNETSSNVPPLSNTTISAAGRARAMNLTQSLQDDQLSGAGMLSFDHGLDDVSMDNDDGVRQPPMLEMMASQVKNVSSCVENGKTYKIGEKFDRGCEETCQCVKGGELLCGTKCKPPLVPKGKATGDCMEEPVEGNQCCVRLTCSANDLEVEPVEDCIHKNETYKRGAVFKIGCESVCTCEAGGRIDCKARCPEVHNITERCVAVPDPNDTCCTLILCDVEEHEINKIDASDLTGVERHMDDNQISSVKSINMTAVVLTFAKKMRNCELEQSSNGVHWENANCTNNNIVSGLQPGKKYLFKLKEVASNVVEIVMPSDPLEPKPTNCTYKGKTYNIDEEFHDGCTSYCICDQTGVECYPIECPTDFGLDVLDPHCLDWETHPSSFVPHPPNCCPEKVLCRDNGSCIYEGNSYPNWSELPTKVTGCEKRCYCEMGHISCQSACPKVPEVPPKTLPCQADKAVLAHPPEDTCCRVWTCPNIVQGTEKTTPPADPTRAKPVEQNTIDTKKSTITKPNQVPEKATPPNKKASSKNVTKDFYPGPFSPQYIDKNSTSQNFLTDLLSPFHLDQYVPEIEKELNFTSHDPKHTMWAVKPAEIPTLVKHPLSTHPKPIDIPNEMAFPKKPTNDKKPPQYPPFYPHEILIQPHNYNQFKLPDDQNQPELDNEAYDDRQHDDAALDEVLTHLHAEHNNVHLPNIHQIQDGNPFGYHPGFEHPSHPFLQRDNRTDEIKINTLEAIDETTIRLVFAVPSYLVGLHGRVELRYMPEIPNNQPTGWELQVLAPPNDLIATRELEFELSNLQPDTKYKIKISVVMQDIDRSPVSDTVTIKTLAPALPSSTLPPIIPVDVDLRTVEVNATYAKFAWRSFTDFELQFIDGVQLRYKELDDKVYAATPLIHRSVTTYMIEELKPDTAYEVGIFFIPFTSQTTELQSQRTVQIRTGPEIDPYKFEVTVDVHHIKTTTIEISWSGVPYPEDKYVNIFRAIYQSDGSREDFSSFKVAKRDSPQSFLIQDLKPATRYRLWLEAYLTNGRTKKSNVKDFITKLGPVSQPSTSQSKLEGMPLVESNSYYGPLVVVSVVAAIAVMSTIILSLILAKKHGTNKAPITSPINRKNNTSAAYDNPSYKTYENDRNGTSAKGGSIALTVFPKNHIEKEA